MIQYLTEKVKMPDLKIRKLNLWINKTAEIYDRKVGDIAFVFCDDEKILEVNQQYLQHDYYTDIITFDYSTLNKISGDIFISLDTVKSNAEQFNTGFNDELHRIIIHGILHLCGQDDKNPDDKTEMTRKENEALTFFLTL